MINNTDIYDLGEYAKLRLISKIQQTNIIPNTLIDIAVNELLMLLSIMSENNNQYSLSNKMTAIWREAISDTLFYKYLCLHSCIKYNSPNKNIIHYDPHQSSNSDTLLLQQVRLIKKFNLIFGRYPTRSLWNEVIRSIESNSITVNISALYNLSNILHRNNRDYSINIIKIDNTSYKIDIAKDKYIKDLVNEIIHKENITIDNLKLVYDGHILNLNEVKLLTNIFENDINPNLYIFIRNI